MEKTYFDPVFATTLFGAGEPTGMVLGWMWIFGLYYAAIAIRELIKVFTK